MAMAFVFLMGLIFSLKNVIHEKPWFLRLALLSLPLPWIASEAGWFVAEYGRQPWTIFNVLPTHLSVSSLSAGEVAGSLTGFAILYTALLIVEMYLMIRIGRKGPSALGTGRYHFEQQ
ncbi:Cytochrome bd ubiquinol oxidase, subunit I [gut metagenome]|uniref:Cytochrome bd ubiquinol oxidase, subunit I n=1 Tax=gut metagenome TaxID=749906 RepID=J9G764_9ZZZZ